MCDQYLCELILNEYFQSKKLGSLSAAEFDTEKELPHDGLESGEAKCAHDK